MNILSSRMWIFSLTFATLCGIFADSPEQIFDSIYQNKVWGKNSLGEGNSGEGSIYENNLPYIEFLQNFLREHKILSVVDVGCGDWEFSCKVDWDGIYYTGYDAAKSVIEKNREVHGSPMIQFVHGNALNMDLPEADLMICKDVLMHLPNENIKMFFKNFKKYKYCLITNSVNSGTLTSPNYDIQTGEFRPLDITAPPFSVVGKKVLIYQAGSGTKQVLLIESPEYKRVQKRPFEVSMIEGNEEHSLVFRTDEDKKTYERYINLYQQNMPAKLVRQEKTRIPKIIHQIWLGSPFPEKFKKHQETWKNLHPDWEYKFWTDVEVAQFDLANRPPFDAAGNFGEKSDILRYEILLKYGGLYADIDFDCVDSFDILHENFDFFTGLPGWKTMTLANGLIACTPQHPIMKECVEGIKANYQGQNLKKDGNGGVFDLTGPHHFTSCFMKVTDTNKEKIVVLPATYFYAFPPIENYRARTYELAWKWSKPETFALHHWAASWAHPRK